MIFGFQPNLINGPVSTWLHHIRWIAAIAVAASHLRITLWPAIGSLPMALYPFFFLNTFGGESVVVFFVLSGFLVGGSIVKKSESFDTKSYIIDRISRLYLVLIPAMVLAVTLFQIFPKSCVHPDRILTIIQNILFLQNLGGTPLCNDWPLWSLSSEGFFYVIGPLLILGAIRRNYILLSLALMPIMLSGILLSKTFANPSFGILLWLLGLFPWYCRLNLPAWAAFGQFCMALLISRLHLVPYTVVENLVVGLSFTVLLCSRFADLKAPFPKLAEALAKPSYSLYLIHSPIFAATSTMIGFRAFSHTDWRAFVWYFVVLMATVATAFAFGEAFEGPQLRRRLSAWLRGTLGQNSAETFPSR